MKKITNKRKFLIPIAILVALIFFVTAVNGALADSGTANDPLVTLSYVEQKISETTDQIDKMVNTLFKSINNNSTKIDNIIMENNKLKAQIQDLENKSGSSTDLEVVHVKKGQKLIGAGGAEIILRSGQANAIGSTSGGLSDITGATDLKSGQNIPLNHLLVVPRNDGRGVSIVKDAYIMIRGEYEIK